MQFAKIFNIRNTVKDFSPHAYSTSWTSQECTLSIKLFFSCRYLSFKPADTNDSSTNTMIENRYTCKQITKLQELKTHISICHLNAQSVVSTFNEFQFMIHETKFDIITLSETWVKNQKHFLEYVNLPGYKLSYRHRNKKEVVMVEYT